MEGYLLGVLTRPVGGRTIEEKKSSSSRGVSDMTLRADPDDPPGQD
jgi:hypothetical protein